MKAEETITKILKEANERAGELSYLSEGEFQQGEMDSIYQDAYMAIFKAGYDKALAQLAGMTEECKQIGRREAVGWITTTFNKGITLDLMMATTTYQEQLKKWGIK